MGYAHQYEYHESEMGTYDDIPEEDPEARAERSEDSGSD